MATLDDLSKIADLKGKGILTEEEFEAEKGRILADLNQQKAEAPSSPLMSADKVKKAKVRLCRACKGEIARKASRCPHCSSKQGVGFVGTVAVLLCSAIVISMAFGSTTPRKPPRELALGESFQTPDFELRVERAEVRSRVGDGVFFNSVAGDGAKYLAVVLSITNRTSRPLSAFSLPTMALIGTDGAKYSTDVGASGSFGAEIQLDTKILSALNPGVATKRSTVFEVPEKVLDGEKWKLLVNADEDVYVLPRKAQQTAAVSGPPVADNQKKSSVEPVGKVASAPAEVIEPKENSKFSFLTSVPRMYLPALHSIYNKEINEISNIHGTIDWNENSPIALAPVYLRKERISGVQDLIVHFQTSYLCGSSGCAMGILLWDEESQKYTKVNELSVTEVALGEGYTEGMRDLALDGVPFKWNGEEFSSNTPAALAPPAVDTQASLCAPGEFAVFSCSVGKKLASICASSDLSPTAGYMQYRFGTQEKVELSVPESKALPTAHAQAGTILYMNGGTAGYVRFNKGEYGYVAYWSELSDGTDDEGLRKWVSANGIVVERSKQQIAHLKCVEAPKTVEPEYLYKVAGFPVNEEMSGFEIPN